MISSRPYKPGYRYGKWAGHPEGVAEDTTCCVAEIFSGERGSMHHQCLKKRGHGPEGRYCRTHDPAVLVAKDEAALRLAHGRDKEQTRRFARARRLSKALGGGRAHYHTASKFKDCGYTEDLVLSFKEVEQLLLLLGREIP